MLRPLTIGNREMTVNQFCKPNWCAFVCAGFAFVLCVGCGLAGLTGHYDDEEFAQMVRGNDVVLVKFGASYCGPCNRLDDELDAVESDLPPGIKVVRLQTSQNPELCEKFGVRSIPRMLLYRDGQQVGDKVGYMTQDQIKSWVGSGGGKRGEVQGNPFAT